MDIAPLGRPRRATRARRPSPTTAMRHHLRTAAALAALLAAAACWSDVNQQQDDSVGAYEPPAGADSAAPTGGPLPTPVDTGDTSGVAGSGMPPAGGRDTSSGPPPR